MTLAKRIQGILDRAERLDPLIQPIRQLLLNGKREHLLAGTDVQGAPFAALAPSTLRKIDRGRRGPGPPLAPRLGLSTIITGYVVQVMAEPRQLRISAGWPGIEWVRYHREGGPHLPVRDPGGFREKDRAEMTRYLKEYIVDDKRPIST